MRRSRTANDLVRPRGDRLAAIGTTAVGEIVSP
jgi:hypothetical protein